jgi:hypothetical protein
LIHITLPAQKGFEKSVQSDAETQSLEKAGTDLIAHEYRAVTSKPAPVTVITVSLVKSAALGVIETQLSSVRTNLSAALPPLEVSDT